MWYLNIYALSSLVGLALLLALIGWVPEKYNTALRKWVLMLFSLSFLAVYSQKLAVFSIAYTLGNYLMYRLIISAGTRPKRWLFAVGIVANVAALFVLRLYSADIFVSPLFAPVIILGLVYTILKVINTFYYAYYVGDRSDISLPEYASYLLFIPTFTSGPIMKWVDFIRDLRRRHILTASDVETGVKRIILGLFKTVVLAALLHTLYEQFMAGELHVLTSAAVLAVFYLFLYFDFSGYSDLAIGFGRLLGVNVPENFKRPFSSPTLTQFWRNWHATLGDWFRDHVYIFLARKKASRLYAGFISFIIMLLVGLWHWRDPSSYLFLMWGAYHGLLLWLETVTKQSAIQRRNISRPEFWLRCALVNIIVAFGTIFFSADAESIRHILQGFTRLF